MVARRLHDADISRVSAEPMDTCTCTRTCSSWGEGGWGTAVACGVQSWAGVGVTCVPVPIPNCNSNAWKSNAHMTQHCTWIRRQCTIYECSGVRVFSQPPTQTRDAAINRREHRAAARCLHQKQSRLAKMVHFSGAQGGGTGGLETGIACKLGNDWAQGLLCMTSPGRPAWCFVHLVRVAQSSRPVCESSVRFCAKSINACPGAANSPCASRRDAAHTCLSPPHWEMLAFPPDPVLFLAAAVVHLHELIQGSVLHCRGCCTACLSARSRALASPSPRAPP